MERVDRRPRDLETVRGAIHSRGVDPVVPGAAGPAWLNALRPAGNRALTGVIVRVAQRQEAPTAEGAADGPAPVRGGEAGGPAGAPPAAGRPSHEILPEEGLP